MPADPAHTVRAALDGLPRGTSRTGRYAVAVKDLRTGDCVVHGSAGAYAAFDTASVVKVDVLAALLLQAQDQGAGLSEERRRLASAMIRDSDNAATDALWRAIGGADGLRAANARLGLTATTPGDGGRWGLTRTTAADQLTLLEAVFAGDADSSPLDRASRAYVRSLMASVRADQRWGVPAAGDAEDADDAALKNGWLPRTATGLWDVNSVGRIEAGGRAYLVTVLSDGQPSHRAGIDLVERVAKTAVGALGDGGAGKAS
ncbi:hypothetical protein GCM10009801_80860 [Streptomyces albiaxialis]|uniref:Beta-lactamase class A catalytic domain-containing protein n=1 Tax=Streptomyces albiaxialis TaxID=329523 RepID=A0ABP5IVA2_9ACTN